MSSSIFFSSSPPIPVTLPPFPFPFDPPPTPTFPFPFPFPVFPPFVAPVDVVPLFPRLFFVVVVFLGGVETGDTVDDNIGDDDDDNINGDDDEVEREDDDKESVEEEEEVNVDGLNVEGLDIATTDDDDDNDDVEELDNNPDDNDNEDVEGEVEGKVEVVEEDVKVVLFEEVDFLGGGFVGTGAAFGDKAVEAFGNDEADKAFGEEDEVLEAVFEVCFEEEEEDFLPF